MMAAGSIVVDLLMRTGSFETDTKRAEKRLKDFQKTTSETATAVAAAAAAMTAAFGYMVKSTLNAMDSMSKMSQQAGVTVEALSGLGYAADLSGVSTEVLAQNLGRLSKGMNEAAQGTGEALKAFKALNIDVTQLRSADQALVQIADRFRSMEDGAQKTALAMQLFGRSGMQMIPFLNLGADGIAKLTSEAESLGVVLSTEAAKAAEEFNDNVKRLQKGLEGLAISISTKMLPALNQLVSGLVNAQKSSFWGWLFTSGEDERNVNQQIDKLENTLKSARSSLETHMKWQENNPMFSWAVGGDIKDLETQIDFVENKLKYLRQVKTQQDEDYWRSRTVNMKSSAVPLVDLTIPSATKPSVKGVMAPQTDELGDFLKKLEQEYQTFINDITGRTDAARKAQQEAWLNQALYFGEITKIEFENAMKSLNNVEEKMSEFTIQAARNIQNVLGDGLYNVLSGRFTDIGSSFADMIKRMSADLMASQLAQVLFGNYGKTGAIGGIAGAIGSALAGAFTGSATVSPFAQGGAGGFAMGGYTGHGGKYEPAGVVHRGEYVLNADSTKKLGVGFLDRLNKGYANGGYVGTAPSAMGGGVNINIKNEAGADGYNATAQARQNTNGGLDIDVLIKRAVAADIRDNGSLAQQMASTFGLRRSM
jgi:hypothetical protein